VLQSALPDEVLLESHAVSEGIRILGESISRKQTNVTSLTQAIVEVKVETALLSEERVPDDSHGSGWLVPLLCVLVVVLMTLLAFIAFWLYRRRLALAGVSSSPAHASSSAHLRHEDLCSEIEKSNNLQNEENLRRYTNPLKSKMDPGGSDEGGPAYRASCIKPDPGDMGGAVAPNMPRVSVVRPLPADATEMMELEVGGSPNLVSQHRHSRAGGGISSQIFKAQSPDVRKNTSPPLTDTMSHKDFAKPLNLKNLPIQRTPHLSQERQDVLTVIV
jgi:hypothetical protein